MARCKFQAMDVSTGKLTNYSVSGSGWQKAVRNAYFAMHNDRRPFYINLNCDGGAILLAACDPSTNRCELESGTFTGGVLAGLARRKRR